MSIRLILTKEGLGHYLEHASKNVTTQDVGGVTYHYIHVTPEAVMSNMEFLHRIDPSHIDCVEVMAKYEFGDPITFHFVSYNHNPVTSAKCFIGSRASERMVHVVLGGWDVEGLRMVLMQIEKGNRPPQLESNLLTERISVLEQQVATLAKCVSILQITSLSARRRTYRHAL